MTFLSDSILVTLRLLKTVLVNVTENRKEKVFGGLLVLIIWHVRRTILLRRKLKTEYVRKLRREGVISSDRGPLLTFGGAGMLGNYYTGVAAYLIDNFDLNNCKFAGISAGASIANALSLNLPVEAIIVCGLRWFKQISETPFGMYFHNSKSFIKSSIKVCNEFNISESYVKQRHQHNPPYFGATNIGVFPWKHEIFSNFDTREESFHVMSCSMRILPFFQTPGVYKKKILMDGIFSALFTIPIEYYDIDDDEYNSSNNSNSNMNIHDNQHKIIRITPMSRIRFADIKPNHLKKSKRFQWIDIFRTPDLNDISKQFQRGYLDAMNARNKLIAKGLIVRKKKITNNLQEKGKQAPIYEMNENENENDNDNDTMTTTRTTKSSNTTATAGMVSTQNNDNDNYHYSKMGGAAGDTNTTDNNNNNNNNDNNAPRGLSRHVSASSSSSSSSDSEDNCLMYDTPGGGHELKSKLYSKCRFCNNIIKKETRNIIGVDNDILICKECGNVDKLAHWLNYLKNKGPEIMFDENEDEYKTDFRHLVNESSKYKSLPLSGKSMRRIMRSEWEKGEYEANQFNIIVDDNINQSNNVDSELDIENPGNFL